MSDRFGDLHRDRARAESFGAVAGDYDRLRAAYADAFVDELARLGPAAVLDVGCGTGKLGAALAARGLAVTGVEPDARMAAVARARGIAVEIASFEAWRDDGRRFDLVTCGNAWHWVDPSLGLAKLERVLDHGGWFAMCFAVDVLDAAVAATFAPVYATHAPALSVYGDPAEPHADVNPLAGATLFSSIERRSYASERIMSADDWAALLATFSNHQRLARERLAALQQGIRAAIARLGGSVRSRCVTDVWLARRAA